MTPEGVIESTWNEVAETFDDMNLKEALLRGIYAYGYERPSAIQKRAILPCIKERDVIAQAQSGKVLFVFCLGNTFSFGKCDNDDDDDFQGQTTISQTRHPRNIILNTISWTISLVSSSSHRNVCVRLRRRGGGEMEEGNHLRRRCLFTNVTSSP